MNDNKNWYAGGYMYSDEEKKAIVQAAKLFCSIFAVFVNIRESKVIALQTLAEYQRVNWN